MEQQLNPFQNRIFNGKPRQLEFEFDYSEEDTEALINNANSYFLGNEQDIEYWWQWYDHIAELEPKDQKVVLERLGLPEEYMNYGLDTLG